jgi:predicted DNA binding CopG/RHH family protein
MKKSAKIPVFKTEDAEREFWSKHDVTDFADFSSAQSMVLANLKPSVESISLRMPKPLLDRLKMLANRVDMPYQSFIKSLLAQDVARMLSADPKSQKAK